MSPELLTDLTVFLLSVLVGFEVISKVPATLHTPLMSAANAIHGVVLVGAMILAVTADTPVGYALALVAAAFAAMNVVGGYAVTDRMLQMFRSPSERSRERPTEGATGTPDAVPPTPASPERPAEPGPEGGAVEADDTSRADGDQTDREAGKPREGRS